MQRSCFYSVKHRSNKSCMDILRFELVALCDVCLFVGCLTSQQQASVSQGRICSDNFTCCHTEIEVVDQTFYLTQSHYTDTGPTRPCSDPITPGAWQGSHWNFNFQVTGMGRPRKIPAQAGFEPGTFRSRGGRLTTRPTRRSALCDKCGQEFSPFYSVCHFYSL